MVVIRDKRGDVELTLCSHEAAVEYPSTVKVAMKLAEIRSLSRHGNDLIIKSEDGESLSINGFFVEVNGIKSDLFLEGKVASAWVNMRW